MQNPIRSLFSGALAASLFFHLACYGQHARTSEVPRLAEKDGRYALLVDGVPYLVLGMQVNNSSAWPDRLPEVWRTAETLHVNTVEAPIYWEQFEPQPGVFNDSALELLLHGARAHHVHLVLLWFGTWKNGSGHYTPAWIKQDNDTYPRVVGKDGRKVDSLSPFGVATLQADRNVFRKLMRRLRELDPEHTVLMVQVENEAGTYGSVRDFSPAAEKVFGQRVPPALLLAMHKQPGTWREVFGQDADEFFHAWSIASYINQVAAAGKAEYALPMYVNAALRDPIHPGAANTYESGGPTDNVLSTWKAAAPSIDWISPDVYMPEYAKVEKVFELYGQRDNPLFVPEIDRSPAYARYLYSALGHQAIGFSVFGTDDSEGHETEEMLRPLATEYSTLAPMQRQIALLNYNGKLQAVSEDPDVHDRLLDFAGWRTTVSFGRPYFGFGGNSTGNPQPVGGALIAQLGPNEFLVTGTHVRVDFSPLPTGTTEQRQFLRVEQGHYEDGTWKLLRVLNGDQTDYGLNFDVLPEVLKVTLGTF